MKKTKDTNIPSIEGEEKFQRTECKAETLCAVEEEILHPLVVDAMKLGWQTVNKGKYADRAGQIDPAKVDISLLFNIKGKERIIAGLLDHEVGSHKENCQSLRHALAPYIRPTLNDYSYQDIAPEKMGVYIDQKAIERNKAAILHEAQYPGERNHYCTLLKDALLHLSFEGTPLKRLPHRAYKKLIKHVAYSHEEKNNLIYEISRTDATLNTNQQGIQGVEKAVHTTVSLIKSLILNKPRLMVTLLKPSHCAGFLDNKNYWTYHNDDTTGILGYLKQQVPEK